MDKKTDILVIGAGPAGLSAAINAVARGKTVRVLSGEHTVLARAERIDNYLGLYHLTGSEMMKAFEEHAAAMGVVPEKGRVSNILPFNGAFMANFSGRIVEARTVILTIGVAKAKPAPGETAFLAHGVSYCATCDGMLYRGKKAVVWGLAPDAAEEADFLRGIGVQVTYVARGERPDGLEKSIPFLSGRLAAVEGEDGRVTAARIETSPGETSLLETEVVFILRSAIAPAALIDGLAMTDGFVEVNRQMETNIPGLFAAGDCVGAPLQIANAVGDGLIAAQQAARYLDQLGQE